MDKDYGLVSSLAELSDIRLDVVVVGSGPAGVAVVEELYDSAPELKIAVVEQGDILLLTHFNSLLPNHMRRKFIDQFGEHPWEGDMKDGMLVPTFGGRGIASGAHLRRFDPADYSCWAEGRWPDTIIAALNRWYPVAESRRRVCSGELAGEAQQWAKEQLKMFAPRCPPVGVDLETETRFEVSRGYDSSASRLWRLIVDDSLQGQARRLWVITRTAGTRLVREGPNCTKLECVERSGRTAPLRGRVYVLAASPIESARLVLNSVSSDISPAVGRYLAEHIERRAKVVLGGSARTLAGEGISLVLTPQGAERDDPESRFQVHLRGERRDDQIIVDIGGFAAMDPNPDSRVTLSASRDRFGLPKAHTSLWKTSNDQDRVQRLSRRIRDVAEQLDVAKFITNQFPLEAFRAEYADEGRIQVMPPGRSYHESGTLRTGAEQQTSATSTDGVLRGFKNVYCADAALFPSVGIANPMLTVTALAYHVADCVVNKWR